jgi:hypothetical protein
MYRYNPMTPKKEKAVKDALGKGNIAVANLDEYVTYIVDMDPTHNSKYASWLVKRVVSDELNLPEDIDIVNELLSDFHTKKHLLPINRRDINSYKSSGQLAEVLAQHLEHRSKRGAIQAVLRDLERGEELYGVKVFLKHGPYTVLLLSKAEIVSDLTQDTRLCVKDESLARMYLENSPIYYFLLNDEPFAMLYMGGSADNYTAQEIQFRDLYNERLSPETLQELRPITKNIIPNMGSLHNVSVNKYTSYLKDILGDFDKAEEIKNKQALFQEKELMDDDLNADIRRRGREDAEWLVAPGSEEVEDLQQQALRLLRRRTLVGTRHFAARDKGDNELANNLALQMTNVEAELDGIRDMIIDHIEKDEEDDDIDMWAY